MNLSKLIIFGAFAVMVAYALITSPLDSLASFNSIEWLASSIDGFFEWFFNLLFGWIF
jgi:hypothetical protein